MVHENMTKEMCEQKHTTLSNELNTIKKKLDEILYILNGNGHLGLSGKVQVIWNAGLFMATTMIVTMIKVWLL